jgi:hypothetical protein
MAARSSSRLNFGQAIARMRAGAILNLQYVRAKPVWELGRFEVAPEVAALLVDCKQVEAANDSLIPGLPGQTWRLRTK